ncbi:MAG: class I SAM-dependent methyltransferase [Candidatus Omnitrophica bacterium]|nr:class I SAM-dependent methyltransferase [Candidatus Omnitrophota bacterium]
MKTPGLRVKFIVILLAAFLSFSRSATGLCAKETSRFRFMVMGCVHYSTFSPEDYDLLVQNINRHNPDFVLFFSDATDYPQEKPMLVLGRDFYQGVSKLSEIPVFDLLRRRHLTGALFTPAQKAALKGNQYFLEYKNNLFIYPAPGDPASQEKPISESQLNLLRNSSGEISSYNNIFLFSPGYSWFSEEKKWGEIAPFLADSKVRYIFGPNMQYFNLRRSGNKYITSKFMPCYLKKCPEPHLHHFLIVDVDERGASAKFASFAMSSSTKGKALSEEKAEAEFHTFREYERKGSLLKVERIVDALKIRPGMDILDIGAGEGFFTVLFAEALKGKGRVFATEVEPGWLETIKIKAQEKGLTNVFPVLVHPEGVDPFYKQHKFDIIFLCESHSCLKAPEDYFRELRPSLKKDGRLYILNRESTMGTGNFTGAEFGNFREVMQIFISEGKDSPLFRRQNKEVQEFIENWQGENIPIEIQEMITRNFNKIIPDRRFFKDYADYHDREEMIVEGNYSPEPGQFNTFVSKLKQYKWFIVGLDSLGAFDPQEGGRTNLLDEPLRMFNKRLLITIFDSTKSSMFSQVKRKSMLLMETAGYELARVHDFNEDYYFLEFRAKP